MSRLTRRHLLRWGALAAAGLGSSALLAACGSPPPTTAPAKPTEAPKPAAEAPKPTAAPAATKPAAGAAAPAATKPAAGAAATTAPAPQGAAPAAKPAGGKAPVTLRFHMRAGGEKSEPAIYVERPGEWEQETGNKIKLEPVPGGKDYAPKISALAAGGTIGDVLFTSDVWSEHTQYVKFNIIEPVDDYLPKYNIKKSEWFKPIVDTLTYNGKMYGLPKTGHPADSYIWINLKLFDQAGIKKPEVYGTTFEQVREWANKLSKGPKDRRDVYGFYTNYRGIMPVTNGIRQFGGDLVDKDGTKSLVDSDEATAWLSWNNDLVIKDGVHPLGDALPAGDNNALVGMFASSKLAMVHTQRFFQFLARNAVKDSFEFMTIQYPRGPKARGWVSAIDTHSGTSSSKFKEEAFTLVAALSDRRFAYLVGKTQGYLTGRVDNLEALKEVASDPFIQLQQKNTEQEEPFWRAKNLRAYELENEMTSQLDTLFLGKKQFGKEFTADFKKSLDAILAKPE